MTFELTRWAGELERAVSVSPEPRVIGRVVVLAQTGSTQDAARSVSANSPGLLLTCGVQTGGRGRLGRSWHDAPGKSLALSLTLDPAQFDPALLSLACGVAVERACARACDVERLGLRWPNDVVDPATGRKLAGVLIERSGELLIAGVGVNVTHRDNDWPAALRDTGVSLAQLGSSWSRLEVALALVGELESALSASQEAVCERWGACDVLVGTERTFVSGGERVSGLVRSIDPMSRIVIESASGARRTLDALTTSLVHADGCELAPDPTEEPGE